jgi:hypothetical protein
MRNASVSSASSLFIAPCPETCAPRGSALPAQANKTVQDAMTPLEYVYAVDMDARITRQLLQEVGSRGGAMVWGRGLGIGVLKR